MNQAPPKLPLFSGDSFSVALLPCLVLPCWPPAWWLLLLGSLHLPLPFILCLSRPFVCRAGLVCAQSQLFTHLRSLDFGSYVLAASMCQSWILWTLLVLWFSRLRWLLAIGLRSAARQGRIPNHPGPNYHALHLFPLGIESSMHITQTPLAPGALSQFDSTKGYPGEGPGPGCQQLTVSTVNIGSLKTNTFWSSSPDDIICIQETRIGKNNFRSARKDVESKGKHLFAGELLPGILQSNGVLKSGWGGTAILASQELVSPLDPKSCPLYQKLFETKRVVAVWAQVTPVTKLLVFSVYARTAASKFPEVYAENDALFSCILECCAQFGPVPILICGDLQLNPMHYKSLSGAINNHSWFDPLSTTDSNGALYRPLTFSNDGLFSGLGDHCTSIDGIICNHVAFSALRSIEVLPLHKVQHRPIRASFSWESITQVGFTLVKTAPFNLEQCSRPDPSDPLCPCHDNAIQIWTNGFESRFDCAPDVDSKWDVANQFLVQVLSANGATWDKGPHVRGKPPKFKETRISPGQTCHGDALSHKLRKISKTLNLLREVYVRLSRPVRSPADALTLSGTIHKVAKQLLQWECPYLWARGTLPTLDSTYACLEWVHQKLLSTTTEVRKFRIQQWRDRIKASNVSDKKFAFQHLKNKASEEPPNLITDGSGNVLYQPLDALAEFNSQWDTVFGANALHEDPHTILRVVWPYVADFSRNAEVPSITAHDLHKQIQRRKKEAAPGLDGWRTAELQILPWFAFVPFATVFNDIEQNLSDLPKVLTIAKQMVLNKNGDPSPMQKRLITLLPVLLLSYTGLRFRQLQNWQNQVIPRNLCGAIRGRTMSAVHTTLRMELDVAHQNGDTLVGLKLDKSKCFDRIIPAVAGALMMAFGAPRGVVHFFVQMYTHLKRHLALRGWISPTPTTACNGVAQGCSLSLIAVNLMMAVWAIFMNLIPHITAKAFIDDAYLWASILRLESLVQAFEVTNFWDSLIGQASNPGKCQLWTSDTKQKARVSSKFPNVPIADTIDVLGVKLYVSKVKSFAFDDRKTEKLVNDVRNISALPLNTSSKAKLIACKVVPQVTYGAAITKIPQRVIWKTQNEIVNVLWANRPHWRSRMLVLGLLGLPHRTEPRIARAYSAILDFVSVLEPIPCFDSNMLRTTGKSSVAP